jgi:hypothetical protein
VGALVGQSGAAAMAPSESSQAPAGGSANVGTANTSGTSGNANQSATPSTGQAQGGPLFAVAQFDKLRILVSVPEGYASDIHAGMAAQVFVQERPGKPIVGTVARSANAIDQNTRTMLTEVDVDNKDGSLYPGMYSVVSFIQTRGVSPLVVPGDAVVVRQDRTAVAVVRDQKIQIVPVEIGRDYGPSVEIVSGISEGDWVVPTVTDSVREGVKVRTRQNQAEGQDATGQGGAQTNKSPDSGPNQYGDQSIVNSGTESTNNQKGKQGQGKQGQSGGSDQKQSGGKQGQQNSKEQKAQKKEEKK